MTLGAENYQKKISPMAQELELEYFVMELKIDLLSQYSFHRPLINNLKYFQHSMGMVLLDCLSLP